MKRKITNFENITQKEFERILYEKNRNKTTYKENYTVVNDVEETKLWLYRDDTDTHIGSYNIATGTAWYYPWIGNTVEDPEIKRFKELMKQ